VETAEPTGVVTPAARRARLTQRAETLNTLVGDEQAPRSLRLLVHAPPVPLHPQQRPARGRIRTLVG